MSDAHFIARMTVADLATYEVHAPMASGSTRMQGIETPARGGRSEVIEGEERFQGVVLEAESYWAGPGPPSLLDQSPAGRSARS